MRVRRVEAGGVGLEVAEAGAGGRPLLLVHGFTGAKEDFTEYLDPLADLGWHAVVADLRGHGASEHPPGEDAYDLELFAGVAVHIDLPGIRFDDHLAAGRGRPHTVLLARPHPPPC